MLGHLIRKEILDQLLSRRFIILSAIGGLAVWLSLYDGFCYYQDRVKDFRLAQTMTEEQITHLKHLKSFEDLARDGARVHKPPTPLIIFVRGLDPVLGRSISNSYYYRKMLGSPVESQPMLGVFPPLDLGLVVQIVLGLFVLLLTYDAVCGEKEIGTLGLTASFPVPRYKLLLSKVVGALLPILSVFGLTLLIGIGVILATGDVLMTGPEWLRLVAIGAAVGLYLMTLTCAGLLGSCLSPRSSTSFVLLITFWVTTVIVIPRVSLIASEMIRPSPSMSEQIKMDEAMWSSMDFKIPSFEEWERKNPAWRDSPEGRESRQVYEWKRREEGRRNRRTTTHRVDEWLSNRYNARLDLATSLAQLSPTFIFHRGTVRLAGAGIDRHQRFEGAFKQDFLSVFWNWLHTAQHISLFQEAHPVKYGQPVRDFSDMPSFTYREPWPHKELQKACFDLGFLALWGLAFYVGASMSMIRYDLR